MPEFTPQALDSLRQPLETGEVVVARANAHLRYPARVQVVGAMNPCRCGHGGLGRGYCGKAPRCQKDYQGRLSGPFLDRIDLHVDVPAVSPGDLADAASGEPSAVVAARVALARERQEARGEALGLPSHAALNSRLDGRALEAAAALDPAGKALLDQAARRGGLTARGWTRTLRLARTIADLEGAETIKRPHLAEALIYRRLDAEPRDAS